MSRRYFGTDGVRGPWGGPVVNEDFAWRLGCAAAAAAKRPGRALVGRDTRPSGEALARAVAAGLRAGGLEPVTLGVVPSPVVAHAVLSTGAALGAMATASHNPAPDNGLKFFRADGRKLSDAEEEEIEGRLPPAAPGGAAPDPAEPFDAVPAYAEAVSRLMPAESLRGWRIVLDTAHGATCATSPAILRRLGADLRLIGGEPDGSRINAEVGSEHPEAMAGLVRREGARLGIAQDGDGDRCILCDEAGAILDGDEILAILALDALSRGTLGAKTLVVTEQSNLGLDALVAAAGGRVVRTAVGDRYVAERMAAEGATLGGESSGHVICREISPAGDGLVAALRTIAVMQASGRPLSALRRALRKFPQASCAVPVLSRRPLPEMPRLAAAMRAAEAELRGRGRILVRYSGTEPKLRLLVEAPEEAPVRAILERLKAAALAEGA